MKLHKLDAAIRAVCPIHGVSLDRKIAFDDAATAQQRIEAQAIADAWDFNAPDPEELAAEAERTAQQALRTDAKATAMFAAIQNATLTQIDNWIDTNFPALNAQQRALLKVLTAAAGAYLRERG